MLVINLDFSDSKDSPVNMKTSWYRAAVLALATGTLFSLAGCAPGMPSTMSSTASTSTAKEAGSFARDLQVCFENSSDTAVMIEWVSGANTNSGSGALEPGQEYCGEGPAPTINLTYSESTDITVVTQNPALGFPEVSFNSTYPHPVNACQDGKCRTVMQTTTYASATYAQGESIGSDVEGHSVDVTRDDDTQWINFTVTILP